MSEPIPGTRCIVATCALDQWALDFDGNQDRIAESIRRAKAAGATYRLGPELETTGYGCEDHFLELDTFEHSDETLAYILRGDLTDGILCDIGCPIIHHNVRYNCRVFCLNRRIVLIRPKCVLADDGNYREGRFFTSWKDPFAPLEDHLLGPALREATGQTFVKFGVAMIQTADTLLASEICEELWSPNSPHVFLTLAGAEIISNGSGSHTTLHKANVRFDLIHNASRKCGGAYLFANQKGCDGGRLYFDGCASVCVNGDFIAQGTQFSVGEVEVLTAEVDLSAIRSYRGGINSWQEQSSLMAGGRNKVSIIDATHFALCRPWSTEAIRAQGPRVPRVVSYHSPEEECAMGPACWLWDYLRRSGARGFLLPLSGGADSAAVSAIVFTMCRLVVDEAISLLQKSPHLSMGTTAESAREDSDRRLLRDLGRTCPAALEYCQRVQGASEYRALAVRSLCNTVLHTVYMGTVNSSDVTSDRAKRLSSAIGSYHCAFAMDAVVSAALSVFHAFTGLTPRFMVRGGCVREDLALQNLQARCRMVMSYLCAQLLPWFRAVRAHFALPAAESEVPPAARQAIVTGATELQLQDTWGYLLVLGSGNVDEALRGYFTKYDCSSADINPIGGINKHDIKKMLIWATNTYNIPVFSEIAGAPPSAELRPLDHSRAQEPPNFSSSSSSDASAPTNYSQNDEEEMGMTYDELDTFGRLRKEERCGPLSMFRALLGSWTWLDAAAIAEKVKRFFFFYSINRHKMTTLTPSYHAEGYGPDDNRFDLRPFLYPTAWSRQFRAIGRLLPLPPSIVVTTTTPPVTMLHQAK